MQGDQWAGVVANGLPTPVFNIFKRIINYFIASIMSQAVSMQFSVDNVDDDSEDPNDVELKQTASTMTKYSKTMWERLKMNSLLRKCLLDAALSGDACLYTFWDKNFDTGQFYGESPRLDENGQVVVDEMGQPIIDKQPIMGEAFIERIDNVNVMFGNPNDQRVQTQPYILLIFRELVSKLKKEAKENGIPKDQIDLISADVDNTEQSGDRGKVELEGNSELSGKVTCIIKLWKNEQGNIVFKKSTRSATIRKETKTNYKLYHVGWMNWDERKNSYHGQALGTGLVPNQIFINKMFAMVMLNLMHTAFPKAIYDSTRITSWSNAVGSSIGVAGDINNVADYLRPGEMSVQVMGAIDKAIEYTKELIGASDAALGDVKPDNTSAIIAVQQAAAIPLENIKQNLYQFVEDIGYIWMDIISSNYKVPRKIAVEEDGKQRIAEMAGEQLQKGKLKLKVDVGPSSYWSEITAMQTLDNLLSTDRITFLQYLKRIPDGILPDKEGLIKEIEELEAQAQQTEQEILAQMTPEEQAAYKQMPPEQQQAMMQQAMGGGGMVG